MSPDLLKRVRLKAELESLFGRKVDVIRIQNAGDFIANDDGLDRLDGISLTSSPP
jgi:hypothetical protein